MRKVLCCAALFLSICGSRAAFGGMPCTLTCAPNQTVGNDPNQCGAVQTYPAPTVSGTCSTVTCSPASGSFFPRGTTTVTCSDGGTGICQLTITINDSQPPSITCPASFTVPAGDQTGNSSVPYTLTASDNCPGVTAAGTPPSGGAFPNGTTTVTATATDASSNTATCGFNITVTGLPVIAVPALSGGGLLLLGAGLAGLGIWALSRTRS